MYIYNGEELTNAWTLSALTTFYRSLLVSLYIYIYIHITPLNPWTVDMNMFLNTTGLDSISPSLFLIGTSIHCIGTSWPCFVRQVQIHWLKTKKSTNSTPRIKQNKLLGQNNWSLDGSSIIGTNKNHKIPILTQHLSNSMGGTSSGFNCRKWRFRSRDTLLRYWPPWPALIASAHGPSKTCPWARNSSETTAKHSWALPKLLSSAAALRAPIIYLWAKHWK